MFQQNVTKQNKIDKKKKSPNKDDEERMKEKSHVSSSSTTTMGRQLSLEEEQTNSRADVEGQSEATTRVPKPGNDEKIDLIDNGQNHESNPVQSSDTGGLEALLAAIRNPQTKSLKRTGLREW